MDAQWTPHICGQNALARIKSFLPSTCVSLSPPPDKCDSSTIMGHPLGAHRTPIGRPFYKSHSLKSWRLAFRRIGRLAWPEAMSHSLNPMGVLEINVSEDRPIGLA